MLIIGEIGGPQEAEAAEWIRSNMTKPVVGYVAGLTAPKGRRMGHAGAIISSKGDSAAEKAEIMRSFGLAVAPSPGELGIDHGEGAAEPEAGGLTAMPALARCGGVDDGTRPEAFASTPASAGAADLLFGLLLRRRPAPPPEIEPFLRGGAALAGLLARAARARAAGAEHLVPAPLHRRAERCDGQAPRPGAHRRTRRAPRHLRQRAHRGSPRRRQGRGDHGASSVRCASAP